MARTESGGTRALAVRLSWAVAALMTLQAGAGLVFPAVYRDVTWIRTAWFGTDVVTLLVGVPLLVAGLVLAARGSVRGELVWYAGLGYGVYNYAYYALGAQLNVLFPLLVALVVSAGWALILSLATADAPGIAAAFPARTPVRAVATYMGLTGLGLAVAWLAQWAAYVFGGTVPSIGEAPFRLVASMDLIFMVPAMSIGAFLVWRRRPWGFVLATMAIAQGAAYTLGLTIASGIGGLRGVPGSMEQVPVWGVWTLAGLAAALALLWRAGRTKTA